MYNSTFLWKKGGGINVFASPDMLKVSLHLYFKLHSHPGKIYVPVDLLAPDLFRQIIWFRATSRLAISRQCTCSFELICILGDFISWGRAKSFIKREWRKKTNLVLTKPFIPVFPFFIVGSKIRRVYLFIIKCVLYSATLQIFYKIINL